MKTFQFIGVCVLLAVAYVMYSIDYRRRGVS